MYNWIDQLNELKLKRIPAVLVTIIDTAGSAPCKSGTKMIITHSGDLFGSIGGGRLELQVIEDAKQSLKAGLFKRYNYPLGAKFGQCCGGKVEVSMEVINKEPNLYIFGAGHVGQALAQTVINTVFNVILIDSRDKWFDNLKLDKGITIQTDSEDNFEELVKWSETHSYVVIMTHSHDLDQEIIEFSIQQKRKYIGLIGSKTKWKRFCDRISKRKGLIDQLDSVHCPIGIDIGSQTPQEIAISIAAELLQDYYGK